MTGKHGVLETIAADLVAATMLLTRVPLPAAWTGAATVSSRALGLSPMVGAVAACAPAVILGAAWAAALPGPVAATLALAALVLVTGALHEDGLADVADGFGGGATPDRCLAIMRDSRIGSYGTLALGCGLLLRAASLSHLFEHAGLRGASSGLVGAAALSRAAMLVPLALLPFARTDGLARAVGPVGPATLSTAGLLGLAIAGAAALGGGFAPGRMLVATLLCAAVGGGMAWLARRKIGGVTGDVLGATQQLAEIAVLVTLCAGPLVV